MDTAVSIQPSDDTIKGVGDVEDSAVAYRESGRAVQLRLRRQASVARVTGLACSGYGRDQALGRDLANTVARAFGDEPVAFKIDREVLGPIEAGFESGPAIALGGGDASARDGRDDPFGVYLPNAMIERIHDIDGARLLVNRSPVGVVELRVYGRAAVTGETGLAISCDGGDVSLRVDLADAVPDYFDDVEIARQIEAEGPGPIQVGARRRAAIAGETPLAGSRDCGNYAVAVHLANAIAGDLGDVKVTGRVVGHAGGHLEHYLRSEPVSLFYFLCDSGIVHEPEQLGAGLARGGRRLSFDSSNPTDGDLRHSDGVVRVDGEAIDVGIYQGRDGAVGLAAEKALAEMLGDEQVSLAIKGEAAGAVDAVGQRRDGAIGRYLANAIADYLGDKEVAFAVEGDARRAIDARLYRRPAVSGRFHFPGAAHGRDDSIGGDLADAVAEKLGDEQVPILIEGEAVGAVNGRLSRLHAVPYGVGMTGPGDR